MIDLCRIIASKSAAQMPPQNAADVVVAWDRFPHLYRRYRMHYAQAELPAASHQAERLMLCSYFSLPQRRFSSQPTFHFRKWLMNAVNIIHHFLTELFSYMTDIIFDSACSTDYVSSLRA